MIITPRISEKSYKLAAGNIYVFDVPMDANKAEVTAAVKAEYPDVKVADVRLMIVKGKVKAVNRGKRARPTTATRKDVKKAYVTVADGKIEIAAFNEVANQTSEPAQQAAVETKVKASDESKKAATVTRRRTGNRGDK
ncbi:MAG: 50S ribosomal protein L23 [Candidatus Nomurabacteria bacterium]|jgi:large subunit ribosomal protein L23|nr:50S ribosomal protein L23 [Candidatus Nomurabacteria bacterium]